jgi:Ca2+-binding EF-hand superfamily protein
MVPVGMGWSKYTDMTELYIPEKFKKLDVDGDSYISFDELLEAISGFFDFESEFTTEDIYELNNFFFAQ